MAQTPVSEKQTPKMSTDAPYITNSAKQRLKAGKPVFLFEVWELTWPVVVKIAAQAGFHMIGSVWDFPFRAFRLRIAEFRHGEKQA
jgi:hypothetical protein